MNYEIFPRLTASLNAISAACLALGYIFIKRRQVRAHVTMMVSALLASTVFLACYLIYHAHHGRTDFPRSSWKPLYLVILTSHSILAVVILPLIFLTLWRAAHRRFELHKRISVITLPLWFYVSVTGVVVYWMLYHLAPTLTH